MTTQPHTKNVTLTTLLKIKERREKFASMTPYDPSFAPILADAGVEVFLVVD